MRYALITIEKAEQYGIPTYGRKKVGVKIIISEWDIMRTDKIHGTIEERCEALTCTLIPESEMLRKIKK